jgi:predicted TIM-barrel fold metal-dependent hydrolase
MRTIASPGSSDGGRPRNRLPAVFRPGGAVLIYALLTAAAAHAQGPEPMVQVREDAHVHLFGPESTRLLEEHGHDPVAAGVQDAAAALAMLDRAGTERAAAISGAYLLALPNLTLHAQAAAVRRENEWLAAEVASAGGRLVGFCSVPPLAPYAEAEVRRCANDPHVRGLKLYLAHSEFDLRDDAHAERLGELFGLADALGLDLLVHLRTERADYGAEDVRAFVARVLPRARTVAVQIAHVGGWGGYDQATDAALTEFAEALESGRARRENLFFDLAMVVLPGRDTPVNDSLRVDACLTRLLANVRRIGGGRFLFGSDWPLYETAEYARELALLLPGLLQAMHGTPRWAAAPRLAGPSPAGGAEF